MNETSIRFSTRNILLHYVQVQTVLIHLLLAADNKKESSVKNTQELKKKFKINSLLLNDIFNVKKYKNLLIKSNKQTP